MASIDSLIDALLARFEDVNTYFIQKVASQIQKIGEMNQSSINLYTVMVEMNENVAEINRKLADACSVGTSDLYQIFQKALDDTYTDPRFSRALTLTPLSDSAKGRLEQYVQSVSRQTAAAMRNLANTTAVSQQYKDAVDKAVLAVSAGMQDYGAATREAVRKIGYGGMQVQYASGHHRRLDTALRQNITNAAKQIGQHGSDIMGEALGYDAYEISAHARSAPDHEPVQGRVFLKAEFEKMQSGVSFQDIDGRHYEGFRRPITEWNCMHMALSFSTKYSVRKYTEEQLQKFKVDNAAGCDIGGKHYSLYKAGQLMRQIETETRRQKDTAVAAAAAGDDTLRRECQARINALAARYSQVSAASGIRMRKDRMRVNGFRMVKV